MADRPATATIQRMMSPTAYLKSLELTLAPSALPQNLIRLLQDFFWSSTLFLIRRRDSDISVTGWNRSINMS